MKKLIIVLLGIIMVAALVACNTSKDPAHDHYGGTATCLEKAVCEECGEEYGELAAHAGGTADCLKGAICDTCGEEYTAVDPEKHASKQTEFVANDDGLTHTERHACCKVAIGDPANHHGGDEATCKTKPVCDDCGAVYGDVNPENHETPDDYIYVDNEDGTHTKKYACCEAVIETENHSGTATCLNAAYCDECKKSYGDVNPENHATPDDYIYVDNEDGTHTKKHACCEAVIETVNHSGGTATCNAKAKCEFCQAEYGDVDPTKHVGGTATCTQKAVCDVCEQEYGDFAAHSFTVTDRDETYHWNKCSVCGVKDEESSVKHSVSEWVETDVASTKAGKCSCGYTVATLTENVTAESLTLYTVSELAGKTYAHEAVYAPAVTLNGEALNVNVTPEDTAVVTYENGKLIAASAGKTAVTVTYNVLGEDKSLSFEVVVVRPIAVYDTAIKYFSAMDGEIEAMASLFGSDTIIEAKQTYNGTDYPLTAENGVLKGAFAEVKKPTVCTITVATATYGYTFNVTAYTKVISDYTDFEDMRLTADKKVVKGYFILKDDIDLTNVDIDGDGAVGNYDTFYRYYDPKALAPTDMLTPTRVAGTGITTSNDAPQAGVAGNAGFVGVFDGNGKSITGFRAGNSYGFFGTISGESLSNLTVIKNVAFKNVQASWSSWTKGRVLAEYATCVSVENVYISYNVTDHWAKNFALFGCQESVYFRFNQVIVEYNQPYNVAATGAETTAVGFFASVGATIWYCNAANWQNQWHGQMKTVYQNLYMVAPAAANGRVMPFNQSTQISVYASNDFADFAESTKISLDPTTLNPVENASSAMVIGHWINAYRYDTYAAMAEAGTTQVGNWDISSGSPVWKA
ncbi:MAG: hypothetical protein SOX77_07175 [Candidatus Borkfalkiaceae bacterium]|nr:hypothetical protein [Christensenellaceae bacterium]